MRELRARSVCTLAFFVLTAACGGEALSPSTAGPGTSPPGPAIGPGNPKPAVGWTEIDAEGDVGALVTTADRVCWTSFAQASRASLVACASKSDGAKTDFVRDALVHPGLAARGADLYWSTEMTATIDRAPIAGGATTHVVEKRGPHGRIFASSSGLYWTLDAGSANVHLLSLGADGQPSDVGSLGAADVDLLAMVDYTVYDYPLAFSFANGVRQWHAGSPEAPVQLSDGCFYPTDLVASARFVYWSCQDRTLRWTETARLGRSPSAPHVEQGAGWGYLALHDGLAFATDTVGGRVLAHDPIAARAPVELHRGLASPTRIAVDESGIYVATGRTIRKLQR